jgi:hypothetical protein
VCLHQLVVEDVPEGVRHALAGALDVRGDRVGRGNHLVLKAGVELHVPRLVYLLGGEERSFLLAAIGAHRPENFVVIRSSATISEERTYKISPRSSPDIVSHRRTSSDRSTANGDHWEPSQRR